MREESIMTLRDNDGPAMGGWHHTRLERQWPGDHTDSERISTSIQFWRKAEDRDFQKIPVEKIIRAVCDAYKVTKEDLLSPRRQGHIMVPRYHAIALTVDLRPDLSLSTIGRLFDRDHSTIIHARGAWAMNFAHLRRAHIAVVNSMLFPDAEPMIG